MLSSVDLVGRGDYSISTVTCRNDHRNWSAERPRDDVRVVLVRAGSFRRRIRGTDAALDRMLGYLGLPGEEEQFAHPSGGDLCTSIVLAPAFWRSLAGEAPKITTPTVSVDGRLELAHRRLLRSTRTGDAGSEAVVELVGEIVGRVVASTVPDAGSARDRALVAAARSVIGDGHPAAAGLLPLARFLGVSPYRLSRAFPRVAGVPLTRYRNRVRVAEALDRLEAGEPSLAALAADLGFADQAHLTRTMREHLGFTPTALRRLLSSQDSR